MRRQPPLPDTPCTAAAHHWQLPLQRVACEGICVHCGATRHFDGGIGNPDSPDPVAAAAARYAFWSHDTVGKARRAPPDRVKCPCGCHLGRSACSCTCRDRL